MAATPAAFCPQCGTPLQGAPRFCTNCGATIEAHANTPTVAASQNPVTPPAAGTPVNTGPVNPSAGTQPPPPPTTQPGGSVYTSRSDPSLPPPPPPPVYNPYMTSASSGTPSYAQSTVPNTYTPTPPPGVTPPPQAGGYQVPDYAKKPKGGSGCVIASIVLLLILVVGIGSYVLLTHTVFNNSNSNQASSNTPTSGSQNTSSSTPGSTTSSSSGSASTVQLNLQFTYANINVTLISAQTSHSFADDTSTSAGAAGIVRLTLRENNTTSRSPNYLESESMLLLLPGGNTVQLGNSQAPISPNPGVNRQNWLDFPLNTPVSIDQMILRVGTQSQSQFDIPLRANADLSKYQDKTSTPGTQFKYGPLNMTLKSATLSYSYNAQQATTGNRYVILTLGAANNTTDNVDLYAGTYMRLQAGGNSTEPDNTFTFPYNINGNTTVSGVVAFLVPQDTTSFTLVLLGQSTANPPISQVTQPFQIQ